MLRPAAGYFELTYDTNPDYNGNQKDYIDLDTMEIGTGTESDLRLMVSIGSNVFVFFSP
jgi:hypothetical protein